MDRGMAIALGITERGERLIELLASATREAGRDRFPGFETEAHSIVSRVVAVRPANGRRPGRFPGRIGRPPPGDRQGCRAEPTAASSNGRIRHQ
jgi:hypothetical protein